MPLSSIGESADALTPILGRHEAIVFFGPGMVGASVVALAGVWEGSEVLGPHQGTSG